MSNPYSRWAVMAKRGSGGETTVQSRRASWRKAYFGTDLKDKEELGRPRGTGRLFQAEGTAFAGSEVRELMHLEN